MQIFLLYTLHISFLRELVPYSHLRCVRVASYQPLRLFSFFQFYVSQILSSCIIFTNFQKSIRIRWRTINLLILDAPSRIHKNSRSWQGVVVHILQPHFFREISTNHQYPAVDLYLRYPIIRPVLCRSLDCTETFYLSSNFKYIYNYFLYVYTSLATKNRSTI